MTHGIWSDVHGLEFYLLTGLQMPLQAGGEVHPVAWCV